MLGLLGRRLRPRARPAISTSDRFFPTSLILGLCVLALSTGGCHRRHNIAEINGDGVSRVEFEERIRRSKAEGSKDQQAFLLRSIIDEELLAQQAQHRKWKSDPKVRARLESELRRVQAQLFVESALEKDLSEIALREYYEEHPKEFTRTKIALSHVLISESPGKTSRPDSTLARKKAAKVRDLATKGADFKKLAREYSDDMATKETGGYLGWIGENHPLAILARQVQSLQPGQITGPVESDQGIHIVRVEQPAREFQTPFEQVKESLRYKRQHQLKKEILDGLRAQAKIKILDSDLAEILERLQAAHQQPVASTGQRALPQVETKP